MAIPDWEQRFQFAVTCEYCHNTIMRLPCTCVLIGEAWVYYHNSCAKKAMKEDGYKLNIKVK